MHQFTIAAVVAAIAAFWVPSTEAQGVSSVCSFQRTEVDEFEVGVTANSKEYPLADIQAALDKNPEIVEQFRRQQENDTTADTDGGGGRMKRHYWFRGGRRCPTYYRYVSRCRTCWVVHYFGQFYWRHAKTAICKGRCRVSWWRGICRPRYYYYRWFLLWCPNPRPFGSLRIVRKRLAAGPCICRHC